MKLNLSTPIETPELKEILTSISMPHLLAGTIYQPFMQLLVAPSKEQEDAVTLWELTQKFYANKDGEVDLSTKEVGILKEKLSIITLPWLKVRLLSVLTQ